jgi:hypothetical protein
MSTLTRKQVAELMGVSPDRVGALGRDGRLPCQPTTISYFDEFNRPRRAQIYPKQVIMAWLGTGGHRAEFKPKGRKSRNKVVKSHGIVQFLTESQQKDLEARKEKARLSKPVTKVVRVIGDWDS